MQILFISHCVPNPPDKGEKIRAYHELQFLTSRHAVHLACLARNHAEVEKAYELRGRCASVHVELLSHTGALAGAALRFARGASLTASYYSNRRLKAYVNNIARHGIDATVIYSSAMVPYAPAGIPSILDYVDVDSEKWMDYHRSRGWPYGIEGERLRKLERNASQKARLTLLCTERELALFRGIAPAVRAQSMENGLDFTYFDPQRIRPLRELAGKRFLAFVGSMDYYPNQDGACWFVEQVLPALQQRDSDLEMFIVGRQPGWRVRALARRPGVTVTGAVPDVRPYLASALAVVAPLRIARGIQNKVLEALAMSKIVLASSAVRETFGKTLPAGLLECRTEEDYAVSLAQCQTAFVPEASLIRADAANRFVWERNLAVLANELDSVAEEEEKRNARRITA